MDFFELTRYDYNSEIITLKFMIFNVQLCDFMPLKLGVSPLWFVSSPSDVSQPQFNRIASSLVFQLGQLDEVSCLQSPERFPSIVRGWLRIQNTSRRSTHERIIIHLPSFHQISQLLWLISNYNLMLFCVRCCAALVRQRNENMYAQLTFNLTARALLIS